MMNQPKTPVDGRGTAAAYADASRESVAEQAKRAAQSILDETKGRLESELASGKNRVTDRADGVAEALRDASGKLGSPGTALPDYATEAATQVERLTSYVRSRNVGELIGDVEDFARKEPLLFLGGTFALGLIAARFVKSSNHRVDA